MQIKQKEEYLTASCKIGSMRIQDGWPLGALATETIRKRNIVKICRNLPGRFIFPGKNQGG
jgi:hypothetical protein